LLSKEVKKFFNFFKFLILLKGGCAIKIYPSLGYLPTDPRLITFFKLMELLKIPIFTHFSPGNKKKLII
jgi:hypothetical protein